MPLLLKDPGDGGSFDPIPEDTHMAVCYGIWDLGTQHQPAWDTWKPQIVFTWEIPDLRIDVERDDEMVNLPRAISRIFTASLYKKSNLRGILKQWRGRDFTDEELLGFDPYKCLGISCQLQVIHARREDKVYANVSAVIPYPKQLEKLIPENKPMFYSIEDHGRNIPVGTPDWIKEIIAKSKEWSNPVYQAGNDDDGFGPPAEEDQIPF